MQSQAGDIYGPSVQYDVETRASLLRRVRDWSDDESWQEFFELYWRIIYALAGKAGLREFEAEEVVQATMLAVAKNIRDFRYDPAVGSFKQWLGNQAQWKISDHLRLRGRDEERLREHLRPWANSPATHTGTATVERLPDPRNGLETFFDNDWRQVVGEVALSRVKAKVQPKHFQMFDLYAVKKWPIRRVSETLSVNVAQVYLAKSRISRLLRRETKRVESQLERPPIKVRKPTNSIL